MRRQISTAVLYTLVTTFIFGIAYPYVVTAFAQLLFHEKSNGQLIHRDGTVIGSRIIGQAFTGEAYFHSRPSAAGKGYDAANSGGSNLGPTSKELIDQIAASATLEQVDGSGKVPIDLVTTSASGLDPDITPAAARFQVPRIAKSRHLSEADLLQLVAVHTEGRQFGFLGEEHVNVLELNLDLDAQRLHR